MRTSVFSILIIGLVICISGVGSKAFSEPAMKMESTVFTYEGKEFTRKHTTLKKEDGTSAVNTKLDHNSPAYNVLLQKKSYTGEVTLFGQKCDGNYAPLTDKAGNLTGALMVCITK